MSRAWEFRMVAYSGASHPKAHLMPYGSKLIDVSHVGLASAQSEMRAFESRMRRGEIAYVEVFDLRGFGAERGQLSQERVDLAHPWKGLQ